MVRRSFTIIETVLAATLASLVVLGCMGAFMALERTDRALTARFHEANDLARIQRTMQRAFSTLLMAPESPLEEEEGAEGEGEGGEEGEVELPVEEGEEEDEGAEAEPEPVQFPRILLQADQDPTLMEVLRRSGLSSSGNAIATPQRLELVLSAVPITPPAMQSTVWTQALVGVDDLPDAEAVEAAGVEDYAGVRGAFVLRPDDPDTLGAALRDQRGDDRIGWTLWWQPLDTRSEPARVASNLAACQFLMYRDSQMIAEHVAYAPQEMPTYIQLEVETLSGLYANYLFEVVWAVDQYEDEEQEGSGQGGAGTGEGGRGGGGAGDGAGGGRRPGGGGDGESGARPKPMTPQGAGPGQRLDARPRQAVPPGGGGRGTGSGGGGQRQGPGGGGS